MFTASGTQFEALRYSWLPLVLLSEVGLVARPPMPVSQSASWDTHPEPSLPCRDPAKRRGVVLGIECAGGAA